MVIGDYTVYLHTFPNNKKYVGITCRKPKQRWKNGFGYQHNNHMMSAIKKYGWKNVKHTILAENLTKEDAENMEIELIQKYKSFDREFGYNIELGGKASNRLTEETKQKLREKCSGKNNARYGVEVSAETRQKMRNAKLGKKQSKEQCYKRMCKLGKKVIQLDLDGNLIKVWNSTREAQRALHIFNVHMCCNGYKKTAGGFKWKYEI